MKISRKEMKKALKVCRILFDYLNKTAPDDEKIKKMWLASLVACDCANGIFDNIGSNKAMNGVGPFGLVWNNDEPDTVFFFEKK